MIIKILGVLALSLFKIQIALNQNVLTIVSRPCETSSSAFADLRYSNKGDLGLKESVDSDVTAGAWYRLLSPRTADFYNECPNLPGGERDKFEVGVENSLLVQSK